MAVVFEDDVPADELHSRVAQQIRDLAEARGIKLAHVADRAGVSRSGLFAVLAGETSPTLTWLGKVAEALEVDPVSLLQPVKK